MGALFSTQRSNVQELDPNATSAYRYPPKTGCYFASYFSMGGQRFNTPQPEAYLFGDNSDLNYLSSRPAAFPYPPLQQNEPNKTLKSLVNIRKDSLKLVKSVREGDDDQPTEDNLYSLEFTFDAEVRTAITVYFFAHEEIQAGSAGAVYTARDPALRSETFHYQQGSNQTFYQPAFTFDPSSFDDDEFNYVPGKDIIPIVIQCKVEEGDAQTGHSHALFGTLEQTMENTYIIKPLKQKQMIDGVYYILQEIFGIENKNSADSLKTPAEDDYTDDIGSDCVICMSDARDTLILPCRHLCLCSTCADSLRYQASCCPICRAPFRALLQIRALRKAGPGNSTATDDDEHAASQENVPAGYEAIPLDEALNGPSPQRPAAEGERPVGSASAEGRSRRGRRKPRSSSGASVRSRTSEDQTAGYREENETKVTGSVTNGSVRSLSDSKKKAKAQAVVTAASLDVVELFQQSNTKHGASDDALKETPPSSADNKSGRSTASPQAVGIEGPEMRPRSAGKGSVKSNRSIDSKGAAAAGVVDRLIVHGLQETSIDGDDFDLESNPAASVMFDETEEPQSAEVSHNTASLSFLMDVELPGTPQSTGNSATNRDSQVSYSSTGSTRQLLSTPSNIQLEEEIHEQMV